MRFKRYTNPKFLEQIGRPMLMRLLERFQPVFTADNVVLPNMEFKDKEYYPALGKLAMAPPGLPVSFIEALYGIEMMSNPSGKTRLMRGALERGLALERIQECTYADFATQVFLADPALFAQKLDETRLLRLTSFDYYGCEESRRLPFRKPDEAGMLRIKDDIDTWLAEEREGSERVTELELFELDSEILFLVRRGDSFARMPTVEGTQIVVRHFRPARDLVVGYSTARDELRVYGKSSGEKQMIRRVFGERLLGDPGYFSVRKAFTLEPLRVDRSEALVVTPGEGIDRVVLTELEVRTDDEHDGALICKANDVFAYAESRGLELFPAGARPVCAGFDIYFTGQDKPRPIHLRGGNRLQLTPDCDGPAVHRWLTDRGFRAAEEPGVNRIAKLSENVLERN